MLGSSKQIKWAKEIRADKIEAISEEFELLGLFPLDRLTVIQKILEAQEDAVWWIDNRTVSCHSLILWAAHQVDGLPKSSPSIASSSGAIYPISLLKPIPSDKGLRMTKGWIAAINSQQPINSHSDILNWQIVETPTVNSLEPTFYLSYQIRDAHPDQSQRLQRLLQKQDGGWSMKGWRFLTICHDASGKIEIEGVTGELIAPLSFISELWQWKLENKE